MANNVTASLSEIERHVQKALKTESKFRILSINMDLLDNFGHFLHLDKIMRSCAMAAGDHFLSFANKNWGAGSIDWVFPWFTNHSYQTHGPESTYTRHCFYQDYRRLVELISGLNDQISTIFFFYSGSYAHLLEIIDVHNEFRQQNITMCINLWWAFHEFEAICNSNLSMNTFLLKSFKKRFRIFEH